MGTNLKHSTLREIMSLNQVQLNSTQVLIDCLGCVITELAG